MRRIRLFFFLGMVLGARLLPGQTFEDIAEAFRDIPTRSALESGLRSWTSAGRGLLKPVLTRPLGFDWTQSFFSLQFGTNHYEILCFAHRDSLTMVWLREESERGISREKRLAWDKAAFLSFCRKYNTWYGSKWSLSEFEADLRSRYIYGFACGFSGKGHTAEALLLGENLQRQSPRQFQSWLRRPSPELQAYGATGLLELQAKRVYRLSEKEKEILGALSSRNPFLFTCAGCMVGLVQAFNDVVIRP